MSNGRDTAMVLIGVLLGISIGVALAFIVSVATYQEPAPCPSTSTTVQQ